MVEVAKIGIDSGAGRLGLEAFGRLCHQIVDFALAIAHHSPPHRGVSRLKEVSQVVKAASKRLQKRLLWIELDMQLVLQKSGLNIRTASH